MSDVVIRVEGLSKRYRLGKREQYRALRDSLTDMLYAPVRLARSALRGERQQASQDDSQLWALKDVSFEVRRGEVVGIIGRNGAGKSTLLKILSRITRPTEGRVGIRGRIGSLLEVGTGFHPELTGRENIFLNGAMLGMRRAEIVRKFDEIVAFAEVEKFIDTPVKHYSSGMYMRLAFAVAAHLEPEILVVDEVLAVGDAEFQKKCFTKMREVGREGRTILFVSHNMAAMRQICQRGIFMEQGQLAAQGEMNAIADRYLAGVIAPAYLARVETPSFVVEGVSVGISPDQPFGKTFAPLQIAVRARAKSAIHDLGMYIGILSLEQQRLSGLDLKDFQTVGPLRAGEGAELTFRIEALPLLPGSYQLEIYLKDMLTYSIELVPQQYSFEVLGTPIYYGRAIDHWFGLIGLQATTGAVHIP